MQFLGCQNICEWGEGGVCRSQIPTGLGHKLVVAARLAMLCTHNAGEAGPNIYISDAYVH